MHEERSQLLAQVPLYVSPYLNLPKAPTLPHNYTTIPSTLPPSILSAPPSQTQGAVQQQPGTPDPPAYVTSAQSQFAAHPSAIIAQNQALLDRLKAAPVEAKARITEWERSIEDRELQEKRRRAPGWLDRDEKILSPERAAIVAEAQSIASVGSRAPGDQRVQQADGPVQTQQKEAGGELGDLMDRAFGGLR